MSLQLKHNVIFLLNLNISLSSMNLPLYKTMKFQTKVQKYTSMIRINLHEKTELSQSPSLQSQQ